MPKSMNIIRTLLVLFCLSLTLFAQAQEVWEKEGEIQSAEVIISKERELTLPPGVRNFSKIPSPDPSPMQSLLNYQMRSIKPEIPSNLARVRFPSVSAEKTNELLPQNKIKLGFGNFLSPLAELEVHSNANEQVAAGLQVHHSSALEGPVGGRNSGNGQTMGRLYGKVFSSTEELSGALAYRNRFLHYYAYEPGEAVNRDSIFQEFNTLNVEAKIESVGDEYPIQYFLDGRVVQHKDRFENSENTFNVDGGLRFPVVKGFDLALKGGYQRQDIDGFQNLTRSLIRVSPTVHFSQIGIAIEAGLNLVQRNDSLENKWRIFPVLNATYAPIEWLQVYGKADGGIQMNTFYSLTEENPFVTAHTAMPFTERSIGFAGGARLFFNPGIQFHFGADIGFYRDMFYFVNEMDAREFPQQLGMVAIVDEGESNILNAFAEFSFDRLQHIHFSLRVDYFRYTLAQLEAPWHMPDFQASLLTKIKATDALSFTVGGTYMRGLQAFSLPSEPVVPMPDSAIEPLDDFIDVQLGVEYRLNKQFSAFGTVNNLLGQNYERYWRYPVRGLQVQAGIIWRF